MKKSPPYKIVVVTGASAGIGRATAHEFARQGASVGLLARGEDGLRQTAEEVEKLGGKALVIPTDVADYGQVNAAAQQVEEHFGPIDVWVNDAMATIFSPFDQVEPKDFKRATEVTYLGYVWGTHVALSLMKTRNKGVIIQVGSALAYRAIPLQSAYCGAKFAIRGFTDAVRSELIHEKSNIHITMVQMPAVNTPQFTWSKNKMSRKPQPVPPVFQPEVAARAIEWSARHRRRELYVGGSVWKAILGNKFFPGLLDKYLAGQAYSGQKRDEAAVPGRPNNLWSPVSGKHSTHGAFDNQAQDSSIALLLSTGSKKVAAGDGELRNSKKH